eukprot:gene12421-6179_t
MENNKFKSVKEFLGDDLFYNSRLINYNEEMKKINDEEEKEEEIWVTYEREDHFGRNELMRKIKEEEMKETIRLNTDTYIQLLKENARLKDHQIEILTRRITELEKYEKEKFDLIKNIETVENNAKYLKICDWFNSTDLEEIDKIVEKYSDNVNHNIDSFLTWVRDKWGYLTITDFYFYIEYAYSTNDIETLLKIYE